MFLRVGYTGAEFHRNLLRAILLPLTADIPTHATKNLSFYVVYFAGDLSLCEVPNSLVKSQVTFDTQMQHSKLDGNVDYTKVSQKHLFTSVKNVDSIKSLSKYM